MSLTTSCIKIRNKLISLEAIKSINYSINRSEYHHLFIPVGIKLIINYYIDTPEIEINLLAEELFDSEYNLAYENLKSEIERIFLIKKDKYDQRIEEEKKEKEGSLYNMYLFMPDQYLIANEKIWCGFGDIDYDLKELSWKKFIPQLEDIGNKITERVMELSQPYNTNFHDVIKWAKKQ